MLINFLTSRGSALFEALGKARRALVGKLEVLLGRELNPAALQEIEAALIDADFGARLTGEVVAELRRRFVPGHPARVALAEAIEHIVEQQIFPPLQLEGKHPWVVMLVGINGNGKTTTCAKLALFCQRCNLAPLVVAADTYRAAGAQQLSEWARRLEIPCVAGERGADPAAVVFDGLKSAVARDRRACIIDTAGRLHTRGDLLGELQKMQRVCSKVVPQSPHEIFLVVEAPSGQNAIQQVRAFASIVPVTGMILTKIDGSAKGGIALALQRECQIPVRFVGTGEDPADLRPFVLRPFIDALLEPSERQFSHSP